MALWFEAKCEVCGKMAGLNGYQECRDCADKRTAAQRAESGIESDNGQQADAALDAACALFPATFGLRAFRGETFRVSRSLSFVSQGQIQVYVQRLAAPGQWNDFTRGTVRELRAQITKL